MATGYSSTEIGGATVPEDLAPIIIDELLAESVVLQARPQVFEAEGAPLLIPRIDALDTDTAWHAENTLITEEDPIFGEVILLPTTLKSLKVLHRFSNELARNAKDGIGAVLATALVRRIALSLDEAMLVGDGAANTVKGIANATGVQTMAAISLVTVNDLHDAHALALGANAKPSAWFMHPRDFTTLRKEKGSDGQYLVTPDPTEANRYQLLGIPVFISTQMPRNGGVGTNESRIILADMKQVAVGRDQEINGTILTETFAHYDQMAIRITARFDIAPLNPEGVVVLDGVTAA